MRWVISKSVLFQCTGCWLGPRMMGEQVSKFLVYHFRLCSCEDLEAYCAAENHRGQHSCSKMALPSPRSSSSKVCWLCLQEPSPPRHLLPSLHPTASAKQCLWWPHAASPHRIASLPHSQQLPTCTGSQFSCSSCTVLNGSFPSKKLFSLGTRHPECVDSD